MRAVVSLLVVALALSSCDPAPDAGDGDGRSPDDGCQGLPATIEGDEGDNVLQGTPGADVILGLGGDDVLLGNGGDDFLCGGDGEDRLDGGEGADGLDGGPGADRCHGGTDGGEKSACEDPVVVAAGDIACDPEAGAYLGGAGEDRACRQRATSDILTALHSNLVAVLVLGDAQYEQGRLEDFLISYDPTWGRFKSLTYPVPGNNEYEMPGAAGYFAYFGDRAGDIGSGYYSFDVAGWHFIALNSLCWLVGGCSRRDPQMRWLIADLAANSAVCTIAYFHHPRFASGAETSNGDVLPIWNALFRGGVDIVLNGHHHHYERFSPVRPSGRVDETRGIRQFIVGTGGVNLEPFALPLPASEAHDDDTFGVLELTLHPGAYEWRFVSIAGAGFTDRGADRCR